MTTLLLNSLIGRTQMPSFFPNQLIRLANIFQNNLWQSLVTLWWRHLLLKKDLDLDHLKSSLGEQGMAQWWERSPPTNVARVQIPASTPYVGWVCCWFSPLLREVFLRVLRFSLSSKTNISKFQLDQKSGRRRTTLWMRYLQIIINIIY